MAEQEIPSLLVQVHVHAPSLGPSIGEREDQRRVCHDTAPQEPKTFRAARARTKIYAGQWAPQKILPRLHRARALNTMSSALRRTGSHHEALPREALVAVLDGVGPRGGREDAAGHRAALAARRATGREDWIVAVVLKDAALHRG